MNEDKLEFIGEMVGFLEPPQMVGPTPNGNRMVAIVRSGTIRGPRINGELLPGGGDWLLWRSDGSSVLDVRATIRTDDGELIYTNYRGIAVFTPEHVARWSAGEELGYEETYFRTSPFFETAAEKYAWMNQIVAIGFGQFTAGGSVRYQLYKVC